MNPTNPQDIYQQEKLARENEKRAAERLAKMKGLAKQISIWGSVVVVLGLIVWGMVFLISHYESPKKPGDVNLTIENKIEPNDWVEGNRSAKVILTEYSDFQCPACGQYFPVVKQLMGEFDKDVAMVYRHFPLPMHPHSKTMAIAAEAAGKQGKFWEMHDLIFTNQSKWTDKSDVKSTITDFAKQLKLNTAQFEKDMASDELKNKIDNTSVEAEQIGLYYTPSFFLNGKLIQNPANFNDFRDLLIKAISDSKQIAATTTKAAN